MATPFKRVCQQAARHVPQQHAISSQRQWSARQFYSHSARRTAAAAPSRNEFTTTDDGNADAEMAALKQSLLDESEISSTAHAELEQHRELREMVRLAAWEMPLLAPLSRPFEQPKVTELPLRWRYTTYFGEPHPASRKVVVEFRVAHLQLPGAAALKLKKLAGPRYKPEKDVVRMSCESFETQAQNKRYLGQTIEKLIKEAKNTKGDSFEDIPLDVRHQKVKKRLVFPEAWRLTPARREALEARRRGSLLEEGKRVEQNSIVSGVEAIEQARQMKLQQVEAPVMAEARKSLPKGKQGKKEMGQQKKSSR
jgi:small subunit ribosomal protein S35